MYIFVKHKHVIYEIDQEVSNVNMKKIYMHASNYVKCIVNLEIYQFSILHMYIHTSRINMYIYVKHEHQIYEINQEVSNVYMKKIYMDACPTMSNVTSEIPTCVTCLKEPKNHHDDS